MFRKLISKVVGFCIPELKPILNRKVSLSSCENIEENIKKSVFSKIYEPYRIINSSVDRGTYVSINSKVSGTSIGKFCSIGPNFVCGWGVHPIDGISTSPFFYSTLKQNGYSIANKNLIEERLPITIGNDVFIGANVTVLDGVLIGDGAIIGAGSASGGSLDVSNLLKPALGRGSLRCIGSTTFQEYRGIFDQNQALSRRFQKIDIVEPSYDECLEILDGIKGIYEEYHNVTYSIDAIKSSVDLSSKYINDRFLPDKAIDVIDETGAMLNITRKNKKNITVNQRDIEKTISKITKIPEQSITVADKKDLKNLEENLKRVIFGQDLAVETLSSAIKLSRVGLRDDNKTIGSFLFTGPTGVGKTEISKQLSEIMGIDLVRFDMSEYMERHTVSRLIGAPPGYVGFDQGGLLTEAIVKSPHCVLLLDEIEKAHPDIFNILLQVMDAGVLTDNNGRKADFRNVILIMTTNIGAELLAKRNIGFSESSNETDAMNSLNKLFTPEFRNRLDETIQFNYLEKSIILSIVDKFLTKLQAQLDKRNVEIVVSKAVISWIADNGYDKEMGARPMERFISKNIKKPLVDKLLFGNLKAGGQIKLDIESNNLKFTEIKEKVKV